MTLETIPPFHVVGLKSCKANYPDALANAEKDGSTAKNSSPLRRARPVVALSAKCGAWVDERADTRGSGPRLRAEQEWLSLREGAVLDLVAVDLRIATNAIGEIVGKTTTEDLLDSIFSTFCIGK